ncbi:MAG: sodium:calcium antiporter [Salinivirgaceae bacterium]|nr:sodium:calcium antiporter [Salinivirgaceae bacterium]
MSKLCLLCTTNLALDNTMEHLIFGLAIMIVSSVVIAKASNVFEIATDYLGRNMNDGVKGLTLNAIGSSFPELLTTVFFLVFATHENLGRDLAASIGASAGSAIFNSIVIPLLVIVVVLAKGGTQFNVSKKVVLRDGIFLVVAELLLLVILSSNYITQWHGWILTSFYVIYIFYALKTMSKGESPNPEFMSNGKSNWYIRYLLKNTSNRNFRSWNLLFFAIFIIGVACAGLVEGCKMIADSMDINPLFVALVLVAAASSIPDTIISMKDARKGNHNDALSNVLGSNIFDITISIGLPLAIFLLISGEKINFVQEGPTLIDIRIMLLIITIITIFVYLFSKKISRVQVFIFFILYLIFIFYAIGAAQFHAGGEGWLAQNVGVFIEWLRQPGGINDVLQKLSNALSKSWR